MSATSNGAGPSGWLGLDVGGTFTDLIYIDADGTLTCRKVPSTPSRPGQSTLDGVDEIVSALSLDESALARLQHVHSSTLATNTLIERRGARIGLLTTRGFRDVLELQRLHVPNAQRYDSERPRPLVPRALVREISARLDAEGNELVALDESEVKAAADELVAAGVEGIVVCFLHSFRNPAHERAAIDVIRNAHPSLDVAASADIWPQAREFERATLATIDVYVRPQIGEYIDQLTTGLAERKVGTEVFIGRSNGGSERAAMVKERPVVVVLSGPAAGVAGAARAAEEAGWPRADLITVDVGGTSADIGVIRDGQPFLSAEEHIADLPVLIPTVAVSSIGAGGGSIIWVDEANAIRIGPRSLGADPGPACYGRQSEHAALTDAFLISNWIGGDQRLGGKIGLDVERSRAALAPLAERVGSTVEEVADAAISIGVAMMAAETMRVLARRGVDAPTFRMVAFGGAGPLLGALLAEEVRIDSVLIPATPGALSAFGAATADVEGDLVAPVYSTTSSLTQKQLTDAVADLDRRADEWFETVGKGVKIEQRTLDWSADMRYDGQGYDVTVALEREWLTNFDRAAIEAAFHAAHDATYGHKDETRDVWVKELRVHVIGSVPKPRQITVEHAGEPHEPFTRQIRVGGRQLEATVWSRPTLPPEGIEGPAIVEQLDTTTLVPPGWRATVTPDGAMILDKLEAAA